MHKRTERKDWPAYFFDLARMVATRATCPRRQVGAIVTVDNHPISTGYNGAPSGQTHCWHGGCKMEDGHCKRAVHAERNAIELAKNYNGKYYRIELWCTTKPCKDCEEYAKKTFPDIKMYWLEDY